jgi:hypothetical protein
MFRLGQDGMLQRFLLQAHGHAIAANDSRLRARAFLIDGCKRRAMRFRHVSV